MMSQQPAEITLYARRVPPRVLRGHVIMGAIQITVGCLAILLNTYGLIGTDLSVSTGTLSGFWTGPFFIAAGATGVAGGRGLSNTQCCIISSLVLSIIASGAGFGAITVNSLMHVQESRYGCSYVNFRMCLTGSDILWFLMYSLEFIVAIVQSAFACRASCCCNPEMPDSQQQAAYNRSGGVSAPIEQLRQPQSAVYGVNPPGYSNPCYTTPLGQ